MPGGYAHLMAVDLLVGSRDLEALNMPGQAIPALKQNLKFCELGAVSPDYPYLDVGNGADAKAWADLMHYQRTGDVIKAAAQRVRALGGAEKGPALAWLLVYPLVDDLDNSYLEGLSTPDGTRKHYDEVFDWALGNVGRWWQAVALGVLDDPKHLDAIVNANLDRGIVEGGPDHGAYVFWPGRAPAFPA